MLPCQMSSLHSFVVTGPKAGAIGTGKLLKAKRSSSPRACRGNGVAVNKAARPTDGRVAEHDCRLMWLTAPNPVGWPEPGSLEAQQPVRLHVARLDAEQFARVEALAHHWEHTAQPLAVQDEGFPHSVKHGAWGQQRLNLRS